MRSGIFAAVLLLSTCGRVGDPRPPIIHIPRKVENLSAVQNGYKVALNWTNPSNYIDGNPATDTGVVHIFCNNDEIGRVAATTAGQPQSFAVDVTNSVDTLLTFTIQFVVPKASKPSPVSNAFSIRPAAVPGSPRNLVPTVDQGKIVLMWEAPERRAELVDSYVVQRSDRPVPSPVRARRFEDTEYDPGKTYTYTITAVRETTLQISGDGSLTAEVAATDKIAPVTPSGLEIQLINNEAFLLWDKNTEAALKGYQVFRSDRPGQPISTVANGYSDREYVSGRGISYRILAEDISGNQSPISAARPGP